MELVGWEATGSGRTRVDVQLGETEATVRLRARWMGQGEVELVLVCRHRVLGSASGVLEIHAARIGDRKVPLPPSDGAVWLEYVTVPPQPAEIASETMIAASGDIPAAFTHVLWLHRYSYFDDGTQLPTSEYDVPPEQWVPVAEVYGQFASPWKLGPAERA